MKAKLLKEQMGVPAGTELDVVEAKRAWSLRTPTGSVIVVPASDVELVPDTEPLSDPLPDLKDPGLLVNIFGAGSQPIEETSETESADTYDFSQDPEPTEEEEPLEPHFSTSPSDLDDDLDEELPTPQGNCDGETCESCQ